MNKAEKKFRLYAILVIFVLLTALLSVINGVNFTMASGDADVLTQMLADRQGSFERVEGAPGGMQTRSDQPGNKDFRMGPMGPDSPEMNASLRYFTVAFSDKGETVETVAFNVSAVTEEEAKEWASSLLKEKTGWTRGTYRYRVYKDHGTTYVTVIDQGRELLPSFRILIISAIGEILVLVTGWFVLLAIGRKIYAPLEEADRKQKNFIANANREFRIPLTIIGGNTELAERKYGPDDHTRSTRRQLGKLNDLVSQLESLRVIGDEDPNPGDVPISEYLTDALEREAKSFSDRGLELTKEIEPEIRVHADPEAMRELIGELVRNALKFALTKVSFNLKNESGHVLLEAKNDTALPDGPVDQVFDRFTTLEAPDSGKAGAGLGLARVK
ncbi:MAG: HAMP domain-containing histidine kinase, partial [Clostridia bacterium]|nr:HAMP domain-containing histidine kinase [Clostridia bacterium]